MNWIRLGNLIQDKQRPSEQGKSIRIADNLAQRVFNPEIEPSEVVSWYIQSQPLAPRASFADRLPLETPDLGEFEALLVGKLLSPPRPVLCDVGVMGCGKSTTKNYVALQLVGGRLHCGRCVPPPQERMIGSIDFNEHIGLNECEPDKLTQELYSIICDELLARLQTHEPISRAQELTSFWGYEIGRYRARESPSRAFRKIIAGLQGISSMDFSSVSDKEKQRREQALALVEVDKELYLDYLIRLWAYVIRTHYGGNRGCAFIILDNIDRVAPVVQKRIADVVHSSARPDGPTFVLLVRPETFDQIGLGTGVIDVEQHHGPTPTTIVLDRLSRFCKDPDPYFDSKDGLSLEEFNTIKKFLQRLQDLIQTDQFAIMQKFLEAACGSSIRVALIMANNLLRASVSDMQSATFTVHDAVRTCVTGGSPQLHWSPANCLEHLFRISTGENGSPLVKPRILRYLGRHSKGRRRLYEIYHIMQGFGYEEIQIREALNDLMRVNCQLVRSNGFDAYYEDNALEKYGGHRVVLTDIGEGYSNYLIYDVDYVQEVMLDAFVDGDHFPKQVDFSYLPDKFRLLYMFLNELRQIDYEETKKFIDVWSPQAYFDTFGKHMLSLDVIHGLYPSVMRILNSVSSRSSREGKIFQDLEEQFTSLSLMVEANNNSLLGIWVPSVSYELD